LNIALKKLHSFIRKCSLTVKLLIFKYRRQNIPVFVHSTDPEVTLAERTTLLSIGRMKTVQLFTPETPDFIAPTPWPANSPDLRLPDLGEAAGACVPYRIHDVAQLKSRFIEEWEYFNQMIN